MTAAPAGATDRDRTNGDWNGALSISNSADYGFSVRIVSLLPSTTEILFAIGVGGDVVGVTVECDYPPEARSRRIVSTSALPSELSAAEIDTAVSAALARGEDLYHLDRDALAGLDPDVVVTQDLCAVCAVDVSVVDDALAFLGCRAQVVTIDPHTLAEVDESILRLGEVTGRRASSRALVSSIRQRTARAGGPGRSSTTAAGGGVGVDRPTVRPRALDPGDGLVGRGRSGDRRRWRGVSADLVGRRSSRAARCGGGRGVRLRPAGHDSFGPRPGQSRCFAPGVRVFAVDANASWARPGTRLVDGIEELADFLHPATVQAVA